MPVKLIIGDKISETLYRASGFFINNENPDDIKRAEADVIVCHMNGELTLHATEGADNGHIGGKAVLGYVPHEPLLIEEVGPGIELAFKQILVTVKN